MLPLNNGFGTLYSPQQHYILLFRNIYQYQSTMSVDRIILRLLSDDISVLHVTVFNKTEQRFSMEFNGGSHDLQTGRVTVSPSTRK